MPVPLTNAALVLAAIFMAGGLTMESLVVGGAGLLNQVLVEIAAVVVQSEAEPASTTDVIDTGEPTLPEEN